MALVFPPLSFAPSSSSSPPTLARPITANLSFRLQRNLILQPRSFNEVKVSLPSAILERRLVIARASSETDGEGGSEPKILPPSEGSGEAVPVENLPLESKLQRELELKLKRKLAKKKRRRRWRLLQKRKMRKKGRWPPSKMKKLKNV